MNNGNVYATTAVNKRAFVMPCNGAATMEGMPRNLWAHLGGGRSNATVTSRLPFFRAQPNDGKVHAEGEKKKDVPNPKENAGDEGTDFARQRIIDMYLIASTAFKRSGVYALG